jgi:hypothetical protein
MIRDLCPKPRSQYLRGFYGLGAYVNYDNLGFIFSQDTRVRGGGSTVV